MKRTRELGHVAGASVQVLEQGSHRRRITGKALEKQWATVKEEIDTLECALREPKADSDASHNDDVILAADEYELLEERAQRSSHKDNEPSIRRVMPAATLQSGVPGVGYVAGRDRWQAQIFFKGSHLTKAFYTTSFRTATNSWEEAREAAMQAAIQCRRELVKQRDAEAALADGSKAPEKPRAKKRGRGWIARVLGGAMLPKPIVSGNGGVCFVQRPTRGRARYQSRLTVNGKQMSLRPVYPTNQTQAAKKKAKACAWALLKRTRKELAKCKDSSREEIVKAKERASRLPMQSVKIESPVERRL
mmetsp:Transcript_55855/g.103389  ORF Transcript_55855/g.103389 Transcript_55855/m.103389 type:complete len:305 (-) Transcript_55855:171-1085(-)